MLLHLNGSPGRNTYENVYIGLHTYGLLACCKQYTYTAGCCPKLRQVGFPSVILLHSRLASAAQCRFGLPEQMLYDETPGRYNAAPRPRTPSHACLGYCSRAKP